MIARAATARDLRRRNRASVLRRLLLDGESTRATLAHECRLSAATAANVVADLIAEGLIEEAGLIPSDGGRPIARLRPRGDSAYFIGADVGEHGITVELFDLQLQRTDREFTAVRSRTTRPAAIATALREAVDTIRRRHTQTADRLVGIGLGVPGIVDTALDGRTTIDAQSLGWKPIDLGDLYADDSVAIFAENGAKTMAAAEAWLSGAPADLHSVVALVGRGLGAGIIVNGSLLEGSSSSAGEWGHTKIALDGRRCTCGANGCLEAYVGGSAITARWKAAGGRPAANEEKALAQLLESATGGDDVALRVLDESIEILGVGLANLVNLFNPHHIIVGGWVGLAIADAHLHELDECVRVNSLRRPGSQFTLAASRLGSEAVALGAALLPLQRLIDGDHQTRTPV